MKGVHPEVAAGAAGLLRGTKEMLLQEGYCKGAYVDGDPCWTPHLIVRGSNPCGTAHCLLGSLRVAAGYSAVCHYYADEKVASPEYRLALGMLDVLAPIPFEQGWGSIAEHFAELDSTTVADLVDLIDRAISELAPLAAPREAVVA